MIDQAAYPNRPGRPTPGTDYRNLGGFPRGRIS